MLTIERAIADRIPAKQLLDVAKANEKAAKGNRRLLDQAAHLRRVAQQLAANDNVGKKDAA